MEKFKLFFRNDLIAGSTAGIAQILIGIPFDIVKVRMQNKPEIYTSILMTGKNILYEEGLFAFYKGLLSPLLGNSFIVAMLFGVNEFSKIF